MKYKVRFTVQFEVEVECDRSELYDRISDLFIPEDEQTKYVEDTFEVSSIKDDKDEDKDEDNKNQKDEKKEKSQEKGPNKKEKREKKSTDKNTDRNTDKKKILPDKDDNESNGHSATESLKD